jgi:5-methylcytosine-specific restriction protein A
MTEGTMPTSEDFRDALRARFARGEALGLTFVEIISGELHRGLGGYPGPTHRMPSCCAAMRAEQRGGDETLHAPPSGQGATLHIRYRLPR